MKSSSSFRVAIVSAVALALPVAAATPAQATVTKEGCTFTARAPKYADTDSAGYKRFTFTVEGSCQPGRGVNFRTEAWEQDIGKPGDTGGNDLLGKWDGVWSQWPTSQKRTWSHTIRMPYDESDGFEELYHRVRFRVSSNGVNGSWSAWDYSSVVKAPH